MKKLITLVVLLPLFISVRAQVTLPYHEDFESAQCESNWHTYNENSDDGEWFYADIATFGGIGYQSSACFMYIYSFANAGNDWMVSPGFNLNAGTSYAFGFKYAEFDESKTERFKVFIGSDSLPAGLTELKLDFDNVNTTAFTNSGFNFTPSASGKYYVGFMVYSDVNQGALLIDEVTMSMGSGVNESGNSDINIEVYPNPAISFILIKNASSSTVSVCDAAGRIMLTEKISNNEQKLDLSNFTKGLYFIQIIGINGVKSQKLLIK